LIGFAFLQNDTGDIKQGVDVIDHIYERAWLTIIAACGRDANADFPVSESAAGLHTALCAN
jgi:hypothetical protein